MHFPYLSHTRICDFEWNGCLLKYVVLVSCNCLDYVTVRGMMWKKLRLLYEASHNLSDVIVRRMMEYLSYI